MVVREVVGMVSVILCFALPVSNTVAQTDLEYVKSQLSGAYGMYRLGDWCLTQGMGFTQQGLDNIKKAAGDFEAQLNDELAEDALWQASAEEAAFILAMMSADTETAEQNCARANVIAGALTAPSSKSKPF